MAERTLVDILARRTAEAAPQLMVTEADGRIRCVACGHRCLLSEGREGTCRVRFVQNGVLRVPRGYVAALQVDPIEKKPFYHVYPGTAALSFGMMGCDLHCSYCQNWLTSQALRDSQAVSTVRDVAPEELAQLAVRSQASTVVSTYNEPLITSEWAIEVFKLAKQAGMATGYVSNGNATPEVLDYLRPDLSLFKVDLKGFTEKGYRMLGGTLARVLETIELLHEKKFWVEVVTLVVPGFNDSGEELSGIATFLAGVSPDIPWHVTAFHEDYKMTGCGNTPRETLIRAAEIGQEAGLRFVYAGNMPGTTGEWENTRCPDCRAVLVKRYGFHVLENRLRNGCCPDCSREIPGVWDTVETRRNSSPGMPIPM